MISIKIISTTYTGEDPAERKNRVAVILGGWWWCVCVCAVARDIVIALGVPAEPRALGPSFPPHSPLVAV